MKFKLIAAAAGSLVLAACNPSTDASVDNGANSATPETNVAATDAPAATPGAQEFVTAVAGSDLYEIESGKIAQEKATAADLKTFGQMLVTDHTKSSEQLKAAVAKTPSAPTPPATLPADLQAKIDALRAASGAEFDRLFVEQQTEGHRKTLDTLKAYSTGGDQPPLREFATNAQTVVEAHLKELTARGQ